MLEQCPACGWATSKAASVGACITSGVVGKCREQKAEAVEAGGAKGRGVLYWLRQDFRLHDNPALSAAAQAARKQVSALCRLHLFHGWHKAAWQMQHLPQCGL